MSEQLIRNPYKFKVIPKDYLHHHILLLNIYCPKRGILTSYLISVISFTAFSQPIV